MRHEEAHKRDTRCLGPFGSMPARLLPGANEVAPQKWAIPLPVEMTRAPVGGSTRDICGEPSFVDLNDLEATKIVVHVLYIPFETNPYIL